MRANRIDATLGQIVEALRKIGALWIPTSGDPSIGFDGIAVWRSRTYLVEIKDGKKPPSKRRLTETESDRLDGLKRQGVRLHIWESAEAALRDIGAVK